MFILVKMGELWIEKRRMWVKKALLGANGELVQKVAQFTIIDFTELLFFLFSPPCR